MENKNRKLRKWFFTIWKMDIDFDTLYNENRDIIRFIAGQKEKGKETGRLHWQGCIHMYNACRITKLRKLFDLGKGENSGNFQPQLGTNKQVLDYVHKIDTSEGEKFEYGKPSQRGFRSDNEDIKKRIEQGESDYDIMQDHFGSYMRYHKGYKYYRQMHLMNKSKGWRNIDIELIMGPSGAGKTRKAYDNHDINDIYKINCNNGCRWFDGYEGQSVLILDEFKNNVKFTYLLDLLDGHQCRLETKGGFSYACWTKVYITTNYEEIEQLYPKVEGELRKPLFRRINKIHNLYEKRNEVRGNIEALTNEPKMHIGKENIEGKIKKDNIDNEMHTKHEILTRSDNIRDENEPFVPEFLDHLDPYYYFIDSDYEDEW